MQGNQGQGARRLRSKIFDSFDQAVADIPDGATIMFAGFGGVGAPQNLIAALHRRGVGDITGITNDHGGMDGRMDVGTLVEAGQVRKLVCAFTAQPHPSLVTPFARLYEEGRIEGELVPQGTLAERIRAAGAGIGAFYTPTGVNTQVAEGKEHRLINGRTYLLELPLPADYAFIRAWRADVLGNLQYRRSQRNFNPIMAMAADITLVEVEKAIEPAGGLLPDEVHTPGIYVDRIVGIPPEGIWA